MTGAPRRSVGRRQPQPLDIGLPMLPVRDIMVVPLPVGREASVRAIESTFKGNVRDNGRATNGHSRLASYVEW